LASKDREKQRPEKKTTPAGVPISITQATYFLIRRIGNIFEQGKFTKKQRRRFCFSALVRSHYCNPLTSPYCAIDNNWINTKDETKDLTRESKFES